MKYVLLMAVALTALTHCRGRVWTSDATLWTSTVRVSPDKPRVLINFALSTKDEAPLVKARQVLDRRISTVTGRPLAEAAHVWYWSATWSATHGDGDTAMEYFGRAYEHDSRQRR